MAWTIKFTETSQKQLKKLDKPIALQVLDFMDKRVVLLEDPRSQGKIEWGPGWVRAGVTESVMCASYAISKTRCC